jgi:hypothetical protein
MDGSLDDSEKVTEANKVSEAAILWPKRGLLRSLWHKRHWENGIAAKKRKSRINIILFALLAPFRGYLEAPHRSIKKRSW